MSNIFISHSSSNNFEAIAIKNWLIEQGWDDIFLDLDPDSGIVAGERWEAALHDAANRCDAVLFLASQAWLKSDWCRKEFHLTHKLNKRIIGILIEDLVIKTLPEELTSTWQLINLASSCDHKTIAVTHPDTGQQLHVHFSTSGLIRLKNGLVKAGLDPLFFEWPPQHDPNRSPYRGMLPLEADDAGIFYGREAPTNELLDKLRGIRSNQLSSLMVILGASGAGKSSFLRAGILPRLSRDDRHFLPLPIIRPENSVLWGEHGLLLALIKIFEEYKLGITRGALREIIKDNDKELFKLLQKLANKAAVPLLTGETGQITPTLVLTIDQGEELFHSDCGEQSQKFMELIKQLALHPKLALVILVTIRSDAYEYLQSNQELENIPQHIFSLAPMPQGAYHNIIEGPARRLKGTDRPLKIDPALTQKLLLDIEEGGNKDSLPLLAFTLQRLYLEYGGNGNLTLVEYEEMGGLVGAINAAVEIALINAEQDPLLPSDRQAIINLLHRGLIPWLAGIDPDSQVPRRRVAKYSEIPIEALPIIEHLIDQRLLAKDFDVDSKEKTIEPAHEALLRQWGLLQGWLKEDFVALSTLESLQRASRDWAANNKKSAWLNHNSGRLEYAELLKQRDNLWKFLSQEDWEYLKACRELENQQKNKELTEVQKLAAAQKRIAKRTSIGMLVAVVLFMISVLLGWQVKQANVETKKQLQEANHNFGLALFERAKQTFAEKRHAEAAYFSANAFSKIKQQDILFQANNIWVKSINQPLSVWSSPPASHHNENINSVAFSPIGSHLVSASSDNVLLLWDVATGKTIRSFTGHSDRVTSVTFSPDGKTLASGSADQQIYLWDIASSKHLNTLEGHTQLVSSVAFSPDGLTLASASDDDSIRLWNVANGKQIKKLIANSVGITSITFSPDGQTLASGFGNSTGFYPIASKNNTIRLWDLNSDNTQTLSGHIKPVTSVAFSPDGQTLASASVDTSIRLWDLSNNSLKTTLKGHNNHVTSLAFSIDGKRLVSGSMDKTLRLWDLTTNKIKNVLIGHTEIVTSVAFSPDGLTLASGSKDNTLRLWDISASQITTELTGHKKPVKSVAFSPDGLTLSSASSDQTIMLWDVVSKQLQATLSKHTGGVHSIAYSHDGLKLASAADDNTIRLWDLSDNLITSTLIAQNQATTSIAFSPNQLILAAGLRNGTTQAWDLSNNKQKSLMKITSKELISITSLTFTPDGLTLATGLGDGSIELWDLLNNKRLNTIQTHSMPINSLIFSPDGATIASASEDKTITLFDLASPDNKATLTNHKRAVNSIAFSFDGSIMASASSDHNIHIWHVASGKLINILTGHFKSVNSVAFSPNSLLLASASSDHTVQLWDIAQYSQLSDESFRQKWLSEQVNNHGYYLNSVNMHIKIPETKLTENNNLAPIWSSTHPYH
ncbi:MAG: TIR domain-containing protein [Alcanivoracaceae bacterium]|nr:TIR domain-containing protein [Alcanivoracaceae bacterium]